MKVIVIGASWCRNCLVMRSRWLEAKLETQISMEYYDFDQNPPIVNLYNLHATNLPACIFLDDQGKERFRLNGIIDKQRIIEIINHFKKLETT